MMPRVTDYVNAVVVRDGLEGLGVFYASALEDRASAKSCVVGTAVAQGSGRSLRRRSRDLPV